MKRSILTMLALLTLTLGVRAEKVAQLLLSDQGTMFFTYEEPVSVGASYDGQTIQMVWSGGEVTDFHTYDGPDWNNVQCTATLNAKRVVFKESFKDVIITKLSYWFNRHTQLETIEGLEYLNTSKVEDMSYMFSDCKSLTALDLTSFDMTKVKGVWGMFYHCENLEVIYCNDVWTNTATDESLNKMFEGCYKLKNYKEASVGIGQANPINGYFTFKIRGVNGDGAENNPFQIASENDWNAAMDFLSKYDSYEDLTYNFKQTADFTVTSTFGTEEHPFKYSYDGDGHTLRVEIEDTQNKYTAPFRYLGGNGTINGTIRNLHVVGAVTGWIHASGLVGRIEGNNAKCVIENCLVEPAVLCGESNGHYYGGGIVGHAGNGGVTVRGCVFTGWVMPTTANQPTYAGAIIGWGDTQNFRTYDCISAAVFPSEQTQSGFNLAYVQNQVQTINGSGNCYSINIFYNEEAYQPIGGATAAYGVKSGTELLNLTFLPNSEDTKTYNVAELTFYDYNSSQPSFTFNGTHYFANGETVQFTASEPETQSDRFDIGDLYYTDSNGTRHETEKAESLYTLTIPAENITLQADITALLFDDSENSAFINDNIGKTYNVKLKGRTLYRNDGAWNTLCLPFNVVLEGSIFEGADIQQLATADFSDGTLTLNFEALNGTELWAGIPYIVKWKNAEKDITDPIFTNIQFGNRTPEPRPEEATHVTFQGTYDPVALTGGDKSMLYLGADNTLYYPSEAMSIGTCRAYFKLNGITAGDIQQQAIVLNYGDGETTRIIPIDNGKLIIDNDGWYTLDGVRLNAQPIKKGLYIHNGRKVVMK